MHFNMDNTKVYPGDVLLNITGASIERSVVFPIDLGEANVSQHVTIIRLIALSINGILLLGILSPLVQKIVLTR
jgi:type I restriction enzyme S subunit